MWVQKFNLPSEETLKYIQAVFEGNKHNYRSIDIKCVATRNDSSWCSTICILRASKSEKRDGKILRYPQFLLIDDSRPIDFIFEFLKGLETGSVRLADEDIKFSASSGQISFRQWVLLPSNNDYDHSNGFLYESFHSGSYTVNIPSEPLIAYNLPHYQDPYEAIQGWTGIRRFHSSYDTRLRTVILFLPEYRARFKAVNWKDGSLNVEIETSTKQSSSPFRIQGNWKAAESSDQIALAFTDSKAQLSIPVKATGVCLYLVDKDSFVYDVHFDNCPPVPKKAEDSKAVSQRIQDAQSWMQEPPAEGGYPQKINLESLHKDIFQKCHKLYEQKSFAEAVEKSFKVVRDRLRQLTRFETGSEAFGKGKLHVRGATAPHVDKDFNEAVKFLTMAIDFFRNEKVHTSDAKIEDPLRAYEYLRLSSLAMHLLDNCEVKSDSQSQ